MVAKTASLSIQPKIAGSYPESKIHGRIITTKVVGVSFDNRQEVVAKLQIGDRVWLEREPNNPFDCNAIWVCANNGEQIGFLNAYLAANISNSFDRYGKPVRGKVHLLTGSSYDNYSLGVIIIFKLPKIHQSQKAFHQNQFDDWDL